MKIYFLLFVISLANFSDSELVDIQCNFINDEFDQILDQYTCSVKDDLMITAKNTKIQTVRGAHEANKSNNDVTGLSIRDKRMLYMPSNLADKFKNLIAIRIWRGKLKEVSQNDFKPFPKLRFLNLDANELEVLEDDLFDFNLLLEVIWFQGNKIKAIGQSTFENLKSLRDLDLSGNDCISLRVRNQTEIESFKLQIKLLCYNSDEEFDDLKRRFKQLSLSDSKLLNGSKMANLTSMILNFTAQITERNQMLQNNMRKLLELQQKKEERVNNFEVLVNSTEPLANCQNFNESRSVQNTTELKMEVNTGAERMLKDNKFLTRNLYSLVTGIALLLIITVVNIVVIINSDF